MTNGPLHQPFDMSDETARARGLAAVLDWYQAMGVDAAVASDATNWLARQQIPPQRFAATPRPSTADIRQQPTRENSTPPGTSASRTAPAQPAPQGVQQGGVPQGVPLGRTAPLRSTPATTRPPLAAPSVTISDEAAEAQARLIARQASSLSELRASLQTFDGCSLPRTAKNLCFFRGAEQARVMVIGDVPRAEEDRAGIPFVGALGRLLDKMLAAISLTEADVHLTQSVYWRPPGNRRPTPQEILICRAFLERQIRFVAPDVIMTCGGGAAQAVLGTNKSILKIRGKWTTLTLPAGDGDAALELPALPTLHPEYLISSPLHKRHAWKDLLALKARLEG